MQHENDDFEILDFTICEFQKMDGIVKAPVEEQQAALKMDTGLLSQSMSANNRFQTKPHPRPINSILPSYSGNAILQCRVTIQVVNDHWCLADFVVKRTQHILGLELAESLALSIP